MEAKSVSAPICDLHRKFDSLEALASASDILPYCSPIHAVGILVDMYDDALNKYQKTKDGYDDLFNHYVTVFRKYMQAQLADFMLPSRNKGINYFTCTVRGNPTNCGSRDWYLRESPKNPTMRFEIHDGENFFKDLEADTGIQREWIYFGEFEGEGKAGQVGLGTSYGGGAPINNNTHGGQGAARLVYSNFPITKDNYDVPNPKEVFEQAIPRAEELRIRMIGTQINMMLSMWDGDYEHVINVYSIPAFLMSQALETIEEVRKIGKEIKEAEIRNRILQILGAVFAVVPFVGQAGAAITGLSAIARTFTALAVGSNVALGVTDIVLNPEMAPVALLGILLGSIPTRSGAARGSSDEMKEMAAIRGEITTDMIRGLGKVFNKNEGSLQKITSRNACKL
jgi:chitinase